MGGGANLLNSPETGDNSGFEAPENDEKNEEEYIVTYKTYQDYFTDLNITAETITENDLVGNGSLANPYIVRSTRGFLWVFGYDYSKISLANKFVEIGCDIILNEEKFDENGNISGGDGTVYNWKTPTAKYVKNLNINGKNHSIYGSFFYDPLLNESITLFGGAYPDNYYINNISNLTLINCYFYARSVSALSGCCRTIQNCIVSGYIYGRLGASAYVGLGGDIINCENYAKISSSDGSVAGTAAFMQEVYFGNPKILNSNNHGDIFGGGRHIGGFIGQATGNLFIENSNNYGKIYSEKGAWLGGFAGIVRKATVKNCSNNVDIVASGSYCGGLFGLVENGNVIINGLTMKGSINKISGYQYGFLFGVVRENTTNKVNIQIKDSVLICNGDRKFVGEHQASIETKIEIISSQIILETKNVIKKFSIIPGYSRVVKYYFRDIKIEVKNEECEELRFGDNTAGNIVIKNCLIEGKNINSVLINHSKTDGLLIINKTGFNNYFHGTDFSGFYCDYKTGKIGLKALSGKGFFQGSVTEQVLLEKGFEKKTI